MFDTGWVLPQQLTPLLMRRALSSSQMAPAGTLPHTHTNTFVCVCLCAHTFCTPQSSGPPASLAQQSLVVSAPCPSSLEAAPSSLLLPPPSLARSLPPSIPPPTPSFHLWQLLIHVTALQMSQLTSWENSRGGEDRRRLERRERGGESATTTATTALHLRRGKAPPPQPRRRFTKYHAVEPTSSVAAFRSRWDSKLFPGRTRPAWSALSCASYILLWALMSKALVRLRVPVCSPPGPRIDYLDLA